MTRLHTYLLVVLFSGFAAVASATNSDRWETLRAINLVENPTNHTGYGSKGELGPYQFRSTTWRMHTSKPFRMANERASADQVAVKHYEWIKERLTSAGIDANSYNIALAWNCGLSAVVSGRIPMQSYHYAERVNNLASDFHRRVEDTSEIVVVSTKTHSPSPAVEFKLATGNVSTQIRFVAGPSEFRVANEAPRFVIAAAAPLFVLASN